jgi:hypothetical protein
MSKSKNNKKKIKDYNELILTHPIKEITKVLLELKKEFGEEEWKEIPERTRVNYINDKLIS